jgi:tRNA(Ile)-lysidine synthase
MEILQRVAETIGKFDLLSPGQRVIVGVSGGADSLCLMSCLNSLGYQITIAHLDHRLRSESAEEAKYVQKICSKMGLEILVERANVRALADQGYSLEEAARLIRYQFLARVAKDRGVDRISTGHTADDQVETVLMHFIRGAGPAGLRGILPDTKLEDWVDIPQGKGIHLVRPLLEIWRSDTEAYCRRMKLDPVLDPSNEDPSFFRNKIRHHLIPILKGYNPGIENVILRMARVMAAEMQMVEDFLQKEWHNLVMEDRGNAIKLDINTFEELPVALQRSSIRRMIKQLHPELRDIGFEHIERAVEFLTGTNRYNRLQLLDGLEILILSPDLAVIKDESHKLAFPEYPQVQGQTPSEISIPGRMMLENGWSLLVERLDLAEMKRDAFLGSLHDRQAALDSNAVKGRIRLRTIQSGDRISPLGMGGSLKVSDLFINHKIPAPARANWPLIVDDEKVIWVVGLRIADHCRITSNTREIIFMRVVPCGEKGR